MTELEPILEVIEEAYEIPHLETTRRITALLPHDYYDRTEVYPVIYLQDGQNLFNPHAPFGDWAIDKSMGKLATHGLKDIIIIAIDHGEEERIKEYMPFYHPKFGEGQGQYYVQFMKEKLIPYINKKYRTLADPEHTGIGGSSMGGLISLYAGLTEPDIFGRLMIFSPSLWISNMIFHHASIYEPRSMIRLYLYGGGIESKTHLPNLRKMASILKEKSVEYEDFTFKFSVNHFGKHGEKYWRNEFPKAVKWLYFNNLT